MCRFLYVWLVIRLLTVNLTGNDLQCRFQAERGALAGFRTMLVEKHPHLWENANDIYPCHLQVRK